MNNYIILRYLNPKFRENVIKILLKYTNTELHPNGSSIMLKGAKVIDIKGHNIEKLIEIETVDDGDVYRYPDYSLRHFTINKDLLDERTFKLSNDEEAKLLFEVYEVWDIVYHILKA